MPLHFQRSLCNTLTWLRRFILMTSSLLFYTAQTAVRLSGAEASNRAQWRLAELKQRLLVEWRKLDHSNVVAAISQWLRRLSACVRAHSGHFEHILWCFILQRQISREWYKIHILTIRSRMWSNEWCHFQWPWIIPNQISRARHYSTSNISETLRNRHIHCVPKK